MDGIIGCWMGSLGWMRPLNDRCTGMEGIIGGMGGITGIDGTTGMDGIIGRWGG